MQQNVAPPVVLMDNNIQEWITGYTLGF